MRKSKSPWSSVKKARNHQDKLWREAIMKQSKGCCERCKRTDYLNAHHILPKEIYPQFRHEKWNGLILCARCHRWGKLSAHGDSIGFTLWLMDNRPEVFDEVIKHFDWREK